MEASDEFESLGSLCVPDSQYDVRTWISGLPQSGGTQMRSQGKAMLGYMHIHRARQMWLASLCMSDAWLWPPIEVG